MTLQLLSSSIILAAYKTDIFGRQMARIVGQYFGQLMLETKTDK